MGGNVHVGVIQFFVISAEDVRLLSSLNFLDTPLFYNIAHRLCQLSKLCLTASGNGTVKRNYAMNRILLRGPSNLPQQEVSSGKAVITLIGNRAVWVVFKGYICPCPVGNPHFFSLLCHGGKPVLECLLDLQIHLSDTAYNPFHT